MTSTKIPLGITALGPEVTLRVEALVAAAERQQDADADVAIDAALRIVPRPMRGVVRRVLIG